MATAGLDFTEDGAGAIASEPWRAGDVILARKDLGVAYHLAVVVDDADAGVTHVIRGEDLRKVLPHPAPAAGAARPADTIYRHHRLILATDGKRLAKRDRGETLRSLREAGVTPAEEFRAQLGL